MGRRPLDHKTNTGPGIGQTASRISEYGEAAGNKLTALLKDHILIAVDLVKAAKEGNKEATAAADRLSRR